MVIALEKRRLLNANSIDLNATHFLSGSLYFLANTAMYIVRLLLAARLAASKNF